jgi:hypothetical protein
VFSSLDLPFNSCSTLILTFRLDQTGHFQIVDHFHQSAFSRLRHIHSAGLWRLRPQEISIADGASDFGGFVVLPSWLADRPPSRGLGAKLAGGQPAEIHSSGEERRSTNRAAVVC